MSLLCSEQNVDIIYGEPLFAANLPGSAEFFALSDEALGQIPLHVRNNRPIAGAIMGINIHRGRSTRNFNGSYTWSEFESAEFLFSIAAAVAEEFLPCATTRMRRAQQRH